MCLSNELSCSFRYFDSRMQDSFLSNSLDVMSPWVICTAIYAAVTARAPMIIPMRLPVKAHMIAVNITATTVRIRKRIRYLPLMPKLHVSPYPVDVVILIHNLEKQSGNLYYDHGDDDSYAELHECVRCIRICS